MNDQPQHEMVLEETHLSGTEEWHCPICGRRMLVNWEPKFKKIVLEVGDDYAIHNGSKGGLQIGSMQVNHIDSLAPEDDTQPFEDDVRLTPWMQWLEEVDFENLWDNET